MFTWAAEIPLAQHHHLASFRLLGGLQAAATSSSWWVRGPRSDAAIEGIRQVPHAQLFHLEAGDTLRPWGRLLRKGRLPDADFQPLRRLIDLRLPVAGWPTARVTKQHLQLERSAVPQPVSLLLTSMRLWHDCLLSAAVIRQRNWTFATCRDGRALIRGTPLPSLPGQQFYVIDGVAIPAGWRCSPPVEGPVLSALVDVPPGGLVLLTSAVVVETVAGDAFVRATPSALRASLQQE